MSIKNAATILWFGPICLFAAPPQLAEQPKQQEKIITTYDMRRSASRELEAAEKEMAVVLAKLESLLCEETQKTKLKASQEAWLNYRKINSDFEAFFWDGGTGQPQIHIQAITRMTKARSAELQKVIDDNFGH
ncbi:lysozyme inhibitor LprI family protein [Geothrix fermentans]|uniref:lysozyme inhibitor LprI family protein n=1 Tax=Geothrix fermentans TaxID=44676 RepID=UPI000A03563A|nr:lysozyme inhibitor LprI family protein [Geothrix fermentans]